MAKDKIENKNTVRDLILLGKAYIISVFLIASFSFIYTIIHIKSRENIFTQDVLSNPVTSFSFILLSIAIWLVRNEDSDKKHRIISNSIVSVTFLIGLTRITFSILDKSYILDQLYFGSLISGIVVFLSSISVWIINISPKKHFKYAQFINYTTDLIGFLSVYGYVYNIDDLQKYLTSIPFTIQSSVCTILLSTGMLFLRPHRGSMATVIGQNSTQIVLLRFLSFSVPLVIGWFKITGTEKDWFGKEFGTALNATLTVAISMTLLGWKSFVQSNLKKTRYENEERIKENRKLIKHILDLSPTTVLIINLTSHKIDFINKAIGEQFRINKKKIKGIKYETMVENLVYKEDHEKAMKRFEESKNFKKDDTNEITYRVKDKNDKINWIISRAAVYKFKDGKPKSIILNSINITEQKELEKELHEKNEELEKNTEELKKINQRLEEINQDLEKEVEKVIQELKENERACKDFFENSFEGILRYGLKDIDGIDIDKPVDEQIKLISKHAIIAEVNKEILNIHKYDSKDDLIGMPVIEFLKMPEEDKVKIITEFIKNEYELVEYPTFHKDKNGDKVALLTSLSGVVENKKLTDAWSTQVLAEE